MKILKLALLGCALALAGISTSQAVLATDAPALNQFEMSPSEANLFDRVVKPGPANILGYRSGEQCMIDLGGGLEKFGHNEYAVIQQIFYVYEDGEYIGYFIETYEQLVGCK